jgi:hypothetical protein
VRVTKEDGFALLTRIGFVARGLLYIAIATLVIALGRAEGPDGALQFLGEGLGRWALYAAAAGFTGYGLWRMADAALGTEHPGDGRKAMFKRIGAATSGVVHLALAYKTVELAMGAGRASENADGQAATVLGLPGGTVLLAAVGAGFAIAGVMQFRQAASCGFLDHLVPEARENAVKWLGRIGYAARGIVFLVIAYFLITAALDEASWKAGGMEQLFATLSRPLSVGLAAGLFLFGLYGLVEAWYRRIRTPDIDMVAAQARGRVT